MAQGKAETLLRQARIRFGDVPAARSDEVRTADATTLDRWLDALIGAESLEEVFENLDIARVVEVFGLDLDRSEQSISRVQAHERMFAKLTN